MTGGLKRIRRTAMNLRLSLARLYIPFWIHKKKLRELFALTAQAFQAQEPPLEGLSRKEVLEKYASFTKENAEEILAREKNIKAVQNLLYEKAFLMGCSLRKTLRISSPAEFMAAARLLYHLMGINFQGEETGQITIRQCYFSRIYSENVCRIVSSLDEGMLAGLSGGRGKLEFSDRLTSGAECCKAVFHFGDRVK
jgi:hypothetical protein